MDIRERRFRAKIKRRADHDLWTGSTDATGKGLVRIDGKLRTAQRAAWEFAHGPLDPHERVLACPDNKACVRVEHLSLAPHSPIGPTNQRRRRGSGSMREQRPGVWQLSVSDGPGPDGKIRRRFLTVHGDETDAAERLAYLAETTHVPTRLGDLRVRELLDRYLYWLGDDDPDRDHLRDIAERILEPAFGRHFAALLDTDDIASGIDRAEHSGITPTDANAATVLLSNSYEWARRRGLTRRNPTHPGDRG